VVRLGPHLELLARASHRQHQPPAGLELIEERPRHVVRRRRDHDDVERALLGPATIAVADAQAHVVIAETVEAGARALGHRRYDLDGEHGARDLVENRRLIARAGADLEHALAALESRGLGHERHDVGLRDGLVVADGQGRVAIGGVAQLLRHELVARHGAHGREHERILHAASHDLLRDHAVPGFGETGTEGGVRNRIHVFSFRVRAHFRPLSGRRPLADAKGTQNAARQGSDPPRETCAGRCGMNGQIGFLRLL